MILCYLSLGSNLNTPKRQLHLAIKAIAKLPYTVLLEVAPFYTNQAWGRKSQPQFCNTVIAIRTRLSPQQLLLFCQNIEKKLGRVRKVRWGARTIDIDLIQFGLLRLNTSTLQLPHPRSHERDFVQIPLQHLKLKQGLF